MKYNNKLFLNCGVLSVNYSEHGTHALFSNVKCHFTGLVKAVTGLYYIIAMRVKY